MTRFMSSEGTVLTSSEGRIEFVGNGTEEGG